ncbi:putative glycoside hydrolase family 13 protein [Favolaschia claudopus]|uniref:Glycoside hydrolase family 13 protein n=1 Tax=Favolaschia claudopus TaxID=2862362 RepID=A0AAW0C0N5_9AGAR
MEAAFNAQIQDLVQRNRTLEHTNKKLVDELALDTDRAKRANRESHAKFDEERVKWREGCNRVVSCYQLAHLRLNAKLSESEYTLLQEMDLSRQEKVARLHRDFQLTMFRIREAELEAKVEELEDMLQDAQRGEASHSADLEQQVRSQGEKIALLNKEKSGVETELSQLRETNSRLQVKAESTETKLQRLTLQFERAQSDNAELERKKDELQRTNDDFRRQLDKWQDLETRGGAETETLRKQRIDLEVEVKALELRLEKNEADLKKEKVRVAKHKKNVDDFEAYIEEQRQEFREVENQLTNAKAEIEALQLELQAERDARPKSPLKRRQASPTVSEDEVANDFTAAPPPSSPAQPPSKKPRSNGPTSRSSGKKAMVAGPSNATDSEIEVIAEPKPRSRGKAKVDADDKVKSKSAVKDGSKPGNKDNKDVKGKAKAVEVVDDSDSDSPPPKKRKRDDSGSKKGTSSQVPEVAERPKPRPRGKAAGGGRAGSVQPRGTTVVSDEESDEPTKKKKKRTIGIFPANSQPTSFNFLPMPNAGGIDIPTDLSPIKETDVVPSRSIASRTGSSNSVLGSLLSTFGRRRP